MQALGREFGQQPAPVFQQEVHEMPVGQIVGTMNEVRSVADVMADLIREYDETVARLANL